MQDNQEITITDSDIMIDENPQENQHARQQMPFEFQKKYLILLGLHTMTIIIYLYQTASMISHIEDNSASEISYKVLNDYSPKSIKIIYHSPEFSYYAYRCAFFIFILKLFVIVHHLIKKEMPQIKQVYLVKIMEFFKLIQHPYITFAIFTWLIIYGLGQVVQLCLYNYSEELEKLWAYQQNLEKGDGDKEPLISNQEKKEIEDEEGQMAFILWVILFGISVLIAVLSKLVWLYIGLHYYKKFILMQKKVELES